MTKTLTAALSLLFVSAALAEPDPVREGSRPTPVEEADRQFLAAEAGKATTAPAPIPAPVIPAAPVNPIVAESTRVAATPSAPGAGEKLKSPRAQPKAPISVESVDRVQPTKVDQTVTVKPKPSKSRIAAQKPTTIRRAIPVALQSPFTTRTESRDRVVVRHYEFPSQGLVRVTTTVTRYHHDDEDRDEDKDND